MQSLLYLLSKRTICFDCSAFLTPVPPIDMLSTYENKSPVLSKSVLVSSILYTHTHFTLIFAKILLAVCNGFLKSLLASHSAMLGADCREFSHPFLGGGHPYSTDVFPVFLQLTKTQFIPMI